MKEGETTKLRGVIERVVDTTGYLACDFHQHSMLGADAPVGNPLTATLTAPLNSPCGAIVSLNAVVEPRATVPLAGVTVTPKLGCVIDVVKTSCNGVVGATVVGGAAVGGTVVDGVVVGVVDGGAMVVGDGGALNAASIVRRTAVLRIPELVRDSIMNSCEPTDAFREVSTSRIRRER